MRTLLFLIVALWGSIGYTGEWVASSGIPESIHNIGQLLPPPVIQTYTIPRPTVVYGVVPYYYNLPVIRERRCWFLRKERQIIYQPQVQWYYQPLYVR